MPVFRTIFLLAVVTGALAGVAMTLMQAAFTVPLIQAAEVYEAAAPAHDHAAGASVSSHAQEAWAPAAGVERSAFSVLANVIAGVGFALVLIAASEFSGGITGWRAGLFWGLAGFVACALAPGLGLPPELPAMPAAELLPRQMWWIGTVAATSTGLAMIFLGKSPLFAILGLAFLLLPHLVGAPQPETFESPVPDALHHRFVVAVTLTNLVFWSLLGAAAGVLRPRVAAALDARSPLIPPSSETSPSEPRGTRRRPF